MRFQEKLKTYPKEKLWDEYCGFLEMSMDEYMFIQKRLMEEQISSFSASGLGKKLLNGREVTELDDFRRLFPLTSYEDYADVLLAKQKDMLPGDPVIWIETTWEGGFKPIKVAPYTRAMLDTYKHNVYAIMMLASGRELGEYTVAKNDRILYGGAPLPYMTGLLPSLLNEELDLIWLPDTNAHSDLSFGQRIKIGFKMAFGGGLDFFFAIGSVANYITEHFGDVSGNHKIKLSDISPVIGYRYLMAKLKHKKDGGKITPGEVFRLKGFVATRTDATHYKERLSKAWGVKPIEICAGTESTCIATDTCEHKGMIFFPDACFYEFIPEIELQKERENTDYIPRTCLMNEVENGKIYELVISVLHDGAFMRYRIGDMFLCIGSPVEGHLPRFTFHDRTRNVIDIAGFTRITEHSMKEVVEQSGLSISDWIVRKEFDESNTPFLHMYVEIPEAAAGSETITTSLLKEHLELYFQHFDNDYSDLKKLLNIDPLSITVLKYGTIAGYEERTGKKIDRFNPPAIDVAGLTEKYDERISYVQERKEN